MSMEQLIESRMSSMKADRTRLAESWAPYINSVKSYMEKQGKTLTPMDEQNIARCLENALLEGGVKSQSKLFETTDSSAISFRFRIFGWSLRLRFIFLSGFARSSNCWSLVRIMQFLGIKNSHWAGNFINLSCEMADCNVAERIINNTIHCLKLIFFIVKSNSKIQITNYK